MISPDHLAMLAASGITAEHAELRGYETITKRKRLRDLKIAAAGCNTPGLLVPLLRDDGSTWGWQYRPDLPRCKDGKPIKYETPYQQRNGLDVPIGVGPLLADPTVALWITEGCKKADCGAAHGLCIVGLTGVWNWMCTTSAGTKMALPEWRDIPLVGRRVVLAFDGDVARKPAVQKSLHALAQFLAYKGAKVEYLWLPDTDDKTGLDDYLTDGHTVEELWRLVKPTAPPPTQPRDDTRDNRQEPEPPKPPVEPVKLAAAHATFTKWLGENYDTDALDLCLTAEAVEKLNGDPLWVLIVSGSGNAKTETVQPFHSVGGIVVSSISSEAALLSATAKRDRAKDATGGLLCQLGDRGLLVIKDVTSILSMDNITRGRVLSALREIYDGRWVRNVGAEGGRTIPWKGRIAVIGAVTTAWDTHHSVITSMGDRFILLRMDSTAEPSRTAAALRAITNTGDETAMRDELAGAVAGVIAGMNTEPIRLTDDESRIVAAAADLVTRARTAVEYDYRGDVIDAHAPEMPTRCAKQLTQIIRGAVAIGIDRAEALRLAIRCARDSMPPLRLAIIDDVAANPHSSTQEVRRRIDKPRKTVDRQLQSLHMLGVFTCDEVSYGDGERVRWYYTLAEFIHPDAIDPSKLARKVKNGGRGEEEEKEEGIGKDRGGTTPDSYFSGQLSEPGERQPATADANAAYIAGMCREGCGNKASPGRTRCEDCHRTWLTTVDGYDR